MRCRGCKTAGAVNKQQIENIPKGTIAGEHGFKAKYPIGIDPKY
jgi:hypothetical protein